MGREIREGGVSMSVCTISMWHILCIIISQGLHLYIYTIVSCSLVKFATRASLDFSCFSCSKEGL